MKTCFRCKKDFPIESFYKDSSKKDGRTPYCKSCRKIKAKIQNDKNPQKARDRARKLRERDALSLDLGRMRMTKEQYWLLYDQQEGVCAICRRPEVVAQKGVLKRLSVDHDHSCCFKKRDTCGDCNRGLLCMRCNNMLGHALDDIETLREAADYLERYQNDKNKK